MRHRPLRDLVRPLVLVSLLAPLLLAGCADDHAHHAGDDAHGDGPVPPSLLVGVENQGARDVNVNVTLLDANETLVWTSEFLARAGALPEKRTDLPGLGVYTVVVRYSLAEGEASGGDSATLDPAECAGLHHLTFVVRADETVENVDVHRECHE